MIFEKGWSIPVLKAWRIKGKKMWYLRDRSCSNMDQLLEGKLVLLSLQIGDAVESDP